MCGRRCEGLDSWHTVVDYSLVGDAEWDERRRVEVCSWRCARFAFIRDESVPEAVRPHYEDAIHVLEAVGVQASHVDEKTARRALQYSTRVLRNLFEIPAELAAPPEPGSEPE